MKKLSVIFVILAVLAIAGCASSGGGGGSSGGAAASGGAEPFSVDLSTVQVASWSYTTKEVGTPAPGVKNAEPFSRQYDGIVIVLPELSNVTAYKRVTIRCKYFNAVGEEIPQDNGKAMVVIAYDLTGDLEGPQMGTGPNTPLKEMNVGGFSGIVNTDKGSRVNLGKAPGGLLFQSSDGSVKFIEVTEITFHD